jgi:hypothetical protein
MTDDELPTADSEKQQPMLDPQVYISDENDTMEIFKKKFAEYWANTVEWFSTIMKKMGSMFKRDNPRNLKQSDAFVVGGDTIPLPPTFEVDNSIQQSTENVIENAESSQDEVSSDEELDEVVENIESESGQDLQFPPTDLENEVIHQQMHSKFQRRYVIPKMIRTIDLFYAILLLSYALSIFDNTFDIGIFRGSIQQLTDLMAERIIGEYAGDGINPEYVGSIAGLFFMWAAVFMLFSSPKRALQFLITGITASILLRLDIANVSNYSKDELFYPLIDVVWGIIFVTGCSLPIFTRDVFGAPNNFPELEYNDEIDSIPMDVFHFESESNEPQPFTEMPLMGDLGEDMGQFDISRPMPPKRRRVGQGSFYEILFLMLSLISWPIALAMHAIIVAEIRIQSFGMDNKWSADQQGFMILLPFYLFSFVCTYCCYKLDQAAREGEIYAKEKAAYHRDMDQYLKLKEAYYRRHASKVAIDSETAEE